MTMLTTYRQMLGFMCKTVTNIIILMGVVSCFLMLWQGDLVKQKRRENFVEAGRENRLLTLYKKTLGKISTRIPDENGSAFSLKYDDKDVSENNLNTKKVLVFSYLPGDNSFFEKLFIQQLEAYYWYEAMGSFFRQFLLEGFPAIKTAIFDDEMNLRKLGDDEKKATIDYLNTILGCEFMDLYPEALDQCILKLSKSTLPLLQCLRPKPKTACSLETFSVCNFTNLDERLNRGCHTRAAAARKCFNHEDENQCDSELEPYMSRLRVYPDISVIQPCIDSQEQNCKTYRIRAVKVVRMTMQSVEAIMNKIPDLKIIYYVMDPRMVYVSRRDRMVPIPKLCEQMLADHNKYLELKNQFPNSIHIVDYEDLAMNPEQIVRGLYDFLGEPVSKQLMDNLFVGPNGKFAKENTGEWFRTDREYTSVIVDEWRRQNEEMLDQNITDVCRGILQSLNYKI